MSGSYSEEELSEIQDYLLYLSVTARPRGRAVEARCTMHQAWRGFLSLNFGDQQTMELLK